LFRVIVEADYALFTRPENKVERVSYAVPTPSALEGMLKSVFWKPSIRYVIDKIVVFNPIVYVNVRRNEVKEKIKLSAVKSQMNGGGGDPCIYTSDSTNMEHGVRHQRFSAILKDVKYGVEFHFEMTGIRSERESESTEKYAAMIRRRIEKGQHFSEPFMGCREFPVKSIRLVDDFNYAEVDPSLLFTRDLGNMLYGLNFKDDERKKIEWKREYFSDLAEAVYYRPQMVDGVIDVAKCRQRGLT